MMTELELVRLIRKGDRKAFDILCREYYAAFISYARMFLPADGAEDVVQDVLLNVWSRRGESCGRPFASRLHFALDL